MNSYIERLTNRAKIDGVYCRSADQKEKKAIRSHDWESRLRKNGDVDSLCKKCRLLMVYTKKPIY